jgi:hypothetical protein
MTSLARARVGLSRCRTWFKSGSWKLESPSNVCPSADVGYQTVSSANRISLHEEAQRPGRPVWSVASTTRSLTENQPWYVTDVPRACDWRKVHTRKVRLAERRKSALRWQGTKPQENRISVAMLISLEWLLYCDTVIYQLPWLKLRFASLFFSIGNSATCGNETGGRRRRGPTPRSRYQHSAILHGRFAGSTSRPYDRTDGLIELCRSRCFAAYCWKVPFVEKDCAKCCRWF